MFNATKHYDNNALEPYLSEETLRYHFGKHHSDYASNLTNLTKNTELEFLSITEIIAMKESVSPKIYNNAAQVFNHDFYWSSLSCQKSEPNTELLNAINKNYGELDAFYDAYINEASQMFGSGWSWLVFDKSSGRKLSIINTHNADTPFTYNKNLCPILTIDLWEHAYYIDYRNCRNAYIEKLIKHCLNWNFANEEFKKI